MLKRLMLLLAVFAIVAAACGDDDDPAATPTTATPPPPATTQAPPPPATNAPPPTTTAPAPTTQAPADAMGASVQVSTSGLGDILTDADGNTLYLFLPDNQGPSVCNGGCAAAWPPLEGEPVAGDGVDATLFGTATRDDGTTQATYNGWPLYYYADDNTAGDTNGQSVNDIWWVISPTGDAIM